MGVPFALRQSKADKIRQALVLLAALTAAEKRRWLSFWTGDESCIKWINPPTGLCMTINEELPE
jgi:hypothetical protein